MSFPFIFYVLGICILEIDGRGQSKENCHSIGYVGQTLTIPVNNVSNNGTQMYPICALLCLVLEKDIHEGNNVCI